MFQRMIFITTLCALFLSGWPAPRSTLSQQSYSPITPKNIGNVGLIAMFETDIGLPMLAFDADNPDILHEWSVTGGMYRQWSIAQGQVIAEEAVSTAEFLMRSPDGNYWAASQEDATLQVLENGSEIKTLSGFQWISDFISFNPTGTMLAATAPTDNVHIWTIDPSTQRQIIVPGEAPVRFSADGFLLAVVDPDHPDTAVVKNLPGVMSEELETTLAMLDSHFAPVTDIAFSPDGLTVATASEDGTISLWNPFNGEERKVLLGHRYIVRRIAFNTAGTLLVSVDAGGTIHGFDTASGALIATLQIAELSDESETQLVWSADGSLFALSGLESILVFGVGGDRADDIFAQPAVTSQTFTAGVTVQGVARFDIQAGDSPINPVGCLIQADDTILALAQDDNGALLVMSSSATCEGAVWLRDVRVGWQRGSSLDDLYVMSVSPQPTPLIRIPDYEARCAGTVGDTTLTSIASSPSVYPPRGIPQSLQATLDTGIDALVCHEYVPVRIENCHYLGPGNYSYIFTRYRTDDVIRLVDYDDGLVIATRRFEGLTPPFCPDRTERGEVHGDPPPANKWSPWVYQVMNSMVDPSHVRTTVRVGNLNVRYLPASDSQSLNLLPVGTPLNLLARDARDEWVAVLLPDMSKGWVFAEYLNIAEQIDLNSLPVSDQPADLVPITVSVN